MYDQPACLGNFLFFSPVLPLVLKVWADGITDKGDYRPLELEPWEFRLLARRTLERLEQNMTKCEVCK